MKFEIYKVNVLKFEELRRIEVCDTLEEAQKHLELYIHENYNGIKNLKVTKDDENNLVYNFGSDETYYRIVAVNKHIEVVAGIIEHDNKILCMQRDDGKFKYVSYKWEFPGGKIEKDETNEDALRRELREEMEMDIDIKDHFYDVEHIYPDFSIKMYCYEVEAKSKNFVMNVHHDFKWLEKDQLFSLDWAPADRPVVLKLMEK